MVKGVPAGRWAGSAARVDDHLYRLQCRRGGRTVSPPFCKGVLNASRRRRPRWSLQHKDVGCMIDFKKHQPISATCFRCRTDLSAISWPSSAHHQFAVAKLGKER